MGSRVSCMMVVGRNEFRLRTLSDRRFPCLQLMYILFAAIKSMGWSSCKELSARFLCTGPKGVINFVSMKFAACWISPAIKVRKLKNTAIVWLDY